MFWKPNIARLAQNRDFKGLAGALKRRDIETRSSAVREIERLVDSGAAGSDQAVDALVELLDHEAEDRQLRMRTAGVLGRIRDHRAVPVMVRYARWAGETIRTAGDRGLSGMDLAPYRYALQTAILALIELKASEVLPDVVRWVNNSAFVEQLAKISSAEALRATLGSDHYSWVNEYILLELARRGSPDSLQPLFSLLETKNERRESIARTLGELSDRSAIDPLAALLCDGTGDEREASLETLRTCFSWEPRTAKEAVWTAITRFQSEYGHAPHVTYDQWRSEVAGGSRPPESKYTDQELSAWLDQVRRELSAWLDEVANGLRSWGAAAAEELLEAVANPERITYELHKIARHEQHGLLGCMHALGCLGDPRALSVLKEYAYATDEAVSWEATSALIRLGGPDVAALLEDIAHAPRKVERWELVYRNENDSGTERVAVDNSDQRDLAAHELAARAARGD